MSDAIRFVLARRGFRAGRYAVGYQSCDNSTAKPFGYDVGKCRANARTYAAAKIVIGLIGGYNSGCVRAQLAVLASVADSRTSNLLDAGHSEAAALTGGYHAAFLIGAVFAGGAALIGGLLLRNQEMPAHAVEEEPAAEAA